MLGKCLLSLTLLLRGRSIREGWFHTPSWDFFNPSSLHSVPKIPTRVEYRSLTEQSSEPHNVLLQILREQYAEETWQASMEVSMVRSSI